MNVTPLSHHHHYQRLANLHYIIINVGWFTERKTSILIHMP